MGTGVVQTLDGGFVIVGSTESFGNGQRDIYLIKTNSNGDLLWTKTYGGIRSDYGYHIEETNDLGYIIVGKTKSFGTGLYNYDIYIVKIDFNGDVMWTRTYGGGYGDDYSQCVKQTSDDGYIVLGHRYSYSGYNVYLIKLDNNGQTLWTKTLEDGYVQHGSEIQLLEDGYIISGYMKNLETFVNDGFLMKTNSVGDVLWTKTYGGDEWDILKSVQKTEDGGFIIIGETKSFGNGETDAYLIKTNSFGEALWTKTFGDIGYDSGNSIQQTTDGGYIFVGYTYLYGASHSDVYLVKTNSDGEELWMKTFGTGGTDVGFSLKKTIDGGYIIAGYCTGNSKDVYLIKTDDEGVATFISEFQAPQSNRKLIKTLDLLGKEIQPKANVPYIEVYDDGTTEKKLIIR